MYKLPSKCKKISLSVYTIYADAVVISSGNYFFKICLFLIRDNWEFHSFLCAHNSYSCLNKLSEALKLFAPATRSCKSMRYYNVSWSNNIHTFIYIGNAFTVKCTGYMDTKIKINHDIWYTIKETYSKRGK